MAPPHDRCICAICQEYAANHPPAVAGNEDTRRPLTEALEDFLKHWGKRAGNAVNIQINNTPEVLKDLTNKCYTRGKEFSEIIRVWFSNKRSKQPTPGNNDKTNAENNVNVPELNMDWYDQVKSIYDFDDSYAKMLNQQPSSSNKPPPALSDFVSDRILSTPLDELTRHITELQKKEEKPQQNNEENLNSFVMVDSMTTSEWEMIDDETPSTSAASSNNPQYKTPEKMETRIIKRERDRSGQNGAKEDEEDASPFKQQKPN